MNSFLLIIFICIVPIRSISHDESIKKLLSALEVSEKIVEKLFNRWQINDFPNFLRSVSMTHSSYEVLKNKYQLKILQTLTAIKEEDKQKFVISFLGSSVTAGHDTVFNITVSQLTENVMRPAFDEVGVKLVVMNGAMGNNRCLPYDACVRVFADPDSDIIQWEQSYDCFGTAPESAYMFEQFIRQTGSMKSKPIIMFSGSKTPNWPESDCTGELPKPVPTSDDLNLLDIYRRDKSVKRIVTLTDCFNDFSAIASSSHNYVMSAAQYWRHSTYDGNKCHGPFVATWECCSLDWHPSILGHEIRSAHYSFFLLMIYQDAIRAILTAVEKKEESFTSSVTTGYTFEELRDKIYNHYHRKRKYPSEALFPSNIPQDVQCLTSYEPIMDQKANLVHWVVDNNSPNAEYFVKDIFENLYNKSIVILARLSGYKDFKYGYYGNMNSKPLSIKINVKAAGTTQICIPPPLSNKYPSLIKPFWMVDAKIYLKTNVANWDNLSLFTDGANGTLVRNVTGEIFSHQIEHSKLLSYNLSDVKDVCLALREEIPIGRHVLSIMATTTDNIFVSTLLIP